MSNLIGEEKATTNKRNKVYEVDFEVVPFKKVKPLQSKALFQRGRAAARP